MALKIKKSIVVKLFEELGFKTAKSWPTSKLSTKIKKLPELTDGVKIRKPKVKKVLSAILNAKSVKIVDATEEAEDKKLQKQMKGGSKKTDKKTGEKKKSGTPKKKAPKGPGVIATILEIIRTKGPISKDQLCTQLGKKFPDRPKEGMMNTINIQVPSRLNKEKNAKIKRNDKGKYYIGR